jgi:suppressor of fused
MFEMAPEDMQTGRSAIDAAIDRCYPTELDHRAGLLAGPGEDLPPLEEVVAFAVSEPSPHWHYISYGLTELGLKETDDPELSGWGFELTMRVAGDITTSPPAWPIHFLRWIAGCVWRDGNALGASHTFLLPPAKLERYHPETDAVGFVVDAELGEITTPNGKVTFLQVIDLHGDEFRLVSRWDANQVFAEIERSSPRFIWSMSRPSVLRGAGGERLRARAAREGSSQEIEYMLDLEWDEARVRLTPLNRLVVANGLSYRVAYGRAVRFISGCRVLEVSAGPPSVDLKSDRARVVILAQDAPSLAEELREGRSAGVFICIEGEAVPPAALSRG